MTNQEKTIKISEVLVSLLNENIGNKMSVSLCQGILNIFQQNLGKLLTEIDKKQNIEKQTVLNNQNKTEDKENFNK